MDKTTKLTPQILAMYLEGCEAIGTTGNSEVRGTLAGVYSDINVHIRRADGNVFTFMPSQVKPILRRLSSMTEDEQKKLVRIEIRDDVTITHTDKYGFTYKVFGDAERDYQQAYGGLSGEQFVYLLSKSFDLFGLIDSGEAIDSQTIGNG